MDGIYTSALYEITSHKTCLESRRSSRRLSPGNADRGTKRKLRRTTRACIVQLKSLENSITEAASFSWRKTEQYVILILVQCTPQDRAQTNTTSGTYRNELIYIQSRLYSHPITGFL